LEVIMTLSISTYGTGIKGVILFRMDAPQITGDENMRQGIVLNVADIPELINELKEWLPEGWTCEECEMTIFSADGVSTQHASFCSLRTENVS
jgi:hypothetical protein